MRDFQAIFAQINLVTSINSLNVDIRRLFRLAENSKTSCLRMKISKLIISRKLLYFAPDGSSLSAPRLASEISDYLNGEMGFLRDFQYGFLL
jgi:hypothetical protein